MMTQENMLARHKILHEVGRGAMGAVYAARDRTTGAVVALKRLDPPSAKSDANFANRFLRHARSARHLTHRNIVKVHDAGDAAGTAYVAMEMLEGENLRKILDGGPIPIARAIQIVREIACGLAHAHLEGVIHGGLKPSNIIVLRSGLVKITDFGIGQLGHAALLSGARAGCLSYLAPEQVRGHPVDHRCDIFSLGALFYEMLTRRPPFEGGSAKEIIEKILHAKPPAPSELNQHVPRALDGVVLSMLTAQAAARMPGVPVLLRELQRVEEGLGLASEGTPVSDEPAASVPPADPKPEPRTPDPIRVQARAPMQDGPRPAPQGEFRDASGPAIRADPSAADEFQHRPFTERELLEYDRAMRERKAGPERSSRSWPAVFTALALVLLVVGIGFTGFIEEWPGLIERVIAASRMQQAPAPATAPAASRPTAPAPVVQATPEPVKTSDAPPAPEPVPVPAKPVAMEPDPVPQTESVVARAPEQPAPAVAAPAPLPAPAVQPTAKPAPKVPPTAKVPAAQPGGKARLILAVSPRGELYIDGKHHGTTPPATTFDIEPGMHRIEVRSGSRKPYLTYMTVQAGDERRIRHDFNAKPSRPPG